MSEIRLGIIMSPTCKNDKEVKEQPPVEFSRSFGTIDVELDRNDVPKGITIKLNPCSMNSILENVFGGKLPKLTLDTLSRDQIDQICEDHDLISKETIENSISSALTSIRDAESEIDNLDI